MHENREISGAPRTHQDRGRSAKAGDTIDFMLPPNLDLVAAKTTVGNKDLGRNSETKVFVKQKLTGYAAKSVPLGGASN